MRIPARRKGSSLGQRVNVSRTVPAPLGGWNDRDALASMKEMDAVSLENWFPKTSYLEIRGGCANHVTGLTTNVSTLAVYNALNGTNKMFAVTSSGVYDASSAGAAGAAVATRTNAKHQCLNFGDGTNNYLMMFNGVDKPLYYDGTNWIAVDAASSPALTGLTTTSIVSAFESKGRLFFIEKDSLSFWYLAAGAAGGALTEYPLDGVAKRGGYLMAGATWTFDGGDGPDDAVAFMTSKGEVLIYRGTNPSSSTTWAIVGRFDIGEPIGRRCLTNYGSELIAITQNGAFPLSAVLKSAVEERARNALTNKIENSFNVASRSYRSNFGWEAIVYPAQSAMIFNIPVVEGGIHYQYVMNTITKAWCKFSGWDAECFAVFNGELYFGTVGKVVKAWTGNADYGGNIVATGKPAFTHFGRPETQKRINLFRPTLAVNGTLSFLTDVDFDFQNNPIEGIATYTTSSGATWDSSYWDSSYWAAGIEVIKNWTSPQSDVGYRMSGKIKVATNSRTVQWMSNEYVFEDGISV